MREKKSNMDLQEPETPSHRKWCERFEAATLRLESVLEELSADERGWAPDLGIGSAVDHILQIAVSARRLRRRFEACGDASDVQGGELQPSEEEILLMLKSCHGAVQEQLRSTTAFTDCDHQEARDREEMLFEHLVSSSHHLGCIVLLQQLIDPSRQSALECRLPVLV